MSNASTSGADRRNCLKSASPPRSRRYSAMSITTATSSPCRVTTCGPSVSTDLISSLNRCFASCNCQGPCIATSV
jgi:hypothetical protein